MSIFSTLLRPISIDEIEERKIEAEALINESPNGILSDVNETVVSATSKIDSISEYFSNKNIILDMSNTNSCFAPVEELSKILALNYEKCKDFYKYLRAMISKKKFDIRYNLYPLSDEERAATISVAEKLGKYGVISDYRIPQASKEIVGTISTAPRVINFLNGDYLEFYARVVVKQVAESLANKYGETYEILSNVFITKDFEKHELDIVFRIGSEVFWSEIKSGKFTDFDCYRRLGVFMGVNPDKHILLSAEKTDDEAKTISWFYQFYVSNIHGFKDTLIKMISKTFEEVEN